MSALIKLAATKRCLKCQEIKEFSLFVKNKACKDGLENRCKACAVKNVNAWQKNNVERKNTNNRKWRENNPEKSNVSSSNWRKNNKGHRNFLTRKYQASKLKRTPSWLTKEEHQQMICLYQVAAMYSRESNQEWHVDHVVPLQGKDVSGLHVPWNLKVIPAIENLRKSNKNETRSVREHSCQA